MHEENDSDSADQKTVIYQHDRADKTQEHRHFESLSKWIDHEQARIGSDLHDGVGQQLTGLALQLRSLAKQVQSKSPNLASELERMSRLASSSVASIRDIVYGLLPIGLEQGDFKRALQSLARSTRRTHGIQVNTRVVGDPAEMPTGRMAEHLYRIMKEAIGNAIKHAHPSKVSLTVHICAGVIRITVSDDGVGIKGTRHTPGVGLRTMRCRAGLIGGLLVVSNARGHGTRVSCIVRRVTTTPSDIVFRHRA
jgi:signal transduction histidine kinase